MKSRRRDFIQATAGFGAAWTLSPLSFAAAQNQFAGTLNTGVFVFRNSNNYGGGTLITRGSKARARMCQPRDENRGRDKQCHQDCFWSRSKNGDTVSSAPH